VEAGPPVVTIFGKSWDLHVTHALGTTLDENVAMIGDSVAYLLKHFEEVIYDAEHFFDGFKKTASTRSRPSARRRRRAPTASSSATPTAAACPMRSWRSSARSRNT